MKALNNTVAEKRKEWLDATRKKNIMANLVSEYAKKKKIFSKAHYAKKKEEKLRKAAQEAEKKAAEKKAAEKKAASPMKLLRRRSSDSD